MSQQVNIQAGTNNYIPVIPKHKVYILFRSKHSNKAAVVSCTSETSNANDKERAVKAWAHTSINDIRPGSSIKVLNNDLTIWRSYRITVNIEREDYNGTTTS